MKLPWILFCLDSPGPDWVGPPYNAMPLPPPPEMTLRAPAVVPPIVLRLELERNMASVPLILLRAIVPVTSVPM